MIFAFGGRFYAFGAEDWKLLYPCFFLRRFFPLFFGYILGIIYWSSFSIFSLNFLALIFFFFIESTFFIFYFLGIKNLPNSS